MPALALRAGGAQLDPYLTAGAFGLGIVAGAFALSWASEAAEVDVSASLAIAILVLVAVLPEYSIEAVLAWKAGASFDSSAAAMTDRMLLVTSNVTGSNRLLVGVGWSLVIVIAWLKGRGPLDLRGRLKVERAMLALATASVSIVVVFKAMPLALAALLVAAYLAYLALASRGKAEEPEMVGPALVIAALPTTKRRMATAALFLYAAAVVVAAAEPFVEALVETGTRLGIEQFILIQWVAPIASEAPELIVAVLFSLRSNAAAGITTLVGAQISQLTLLIGSVGVIFSVSAGRLVGLPLGDRQVAEVALTCAVSVFALLLLTRGRVGWLAGGVLLALFVAQLAVATPSHRVVLALVYLALAAVLVVGPGGFRSRAPRR